MGLWPSRAEGLRNTSGERWREVTAGQIQKHKRRAACTVTRTALWLFIGAVAAVVHRVAQLVAVDAAVVAAAESERRLTLDVHCKFTKVVLKNLHGESHSNDDCVGVCVEVGLIFLQHK